MPKSAVRGARRKRPEEAAPTTPSGAQTADIEQESDALEPDGDETLAALKAELEEANERCMRASAEAENIRRRADKQVEDARKYALEKFARDLLGVQDSLDQAMQIELDDSAAAAVAPMREGIALIARQFSDSLERFSIHTIDPAVGDPFNSEEHQAISTQAKPDVEPGLVLEVVQKGFRLQNRLLRPALVIVSSESKAG